MTRRPIALAVAVVAVVVLLCSGTVVLPVMMFGQSQAEAASCEVTSLPDGEAPDVGKWSGAQVANATVIVTVGRGRQIPARGYVIALATAMQESTLRNLANSGVPESLALPHEGVGSDHDSVGLFQQRPGWGSVRDRMTPSYAATKFYEVLARVDGWERMRLTDAAQAVQRSGYPEEYQKWEGDAELLAAAVLGVADIRDVGGGSPTAPCGVDDLGPVPVGPGGWVQPLHAFVGSPFGPAVAGCMPAWTCRRLMCGATRSGPHRAEWSSRSSATGTPPATGTGTPVPGAVAGTSTSVTRATSSPATAT
ncbi:hypothetical protein GCM10029963_79910 [Micromonospora andamanensis]